VTAPHRPLDGGRQLSLLAGALQQAPPKRDPDPRVVSVNTLLDDEERGCRITLEEGFLSAAQSAALCATLARELPFRPEAPVLFGRALPVRRASCAVGEPGVVYRYTGLERRAEPWPEGVRLLLDRLEERAGVRFNFALCNLYPDGLAGLGWHADDEPDLEPGAPIASLSLGAPRDFAVRRGRAGPALFTVELAAGSLLLMEGWTQRDYQHRVPVRRRVEAPRINLTFRKIRR
jgi:alkylated DNA repair dioxygenase AlkB